MAMSGTMMPLAPIEERIVEFYNDPLFAVVVEVAGQRQVFIPLKPICDYLGLDWSAQYRRVHRNPVLSVEAKLIAVTAIKPSIGAGRPDALCLPLDMLHGWLFGIAADRVRDELREKVLRYQRECYRVLFEAFRSDRAQPQRVDEEIIRALRDNAAQQLRLWDTVLAEQQRLRITEETVQEHDDLLAQAFQQLEALRQNQTRLAAQIADVSRLLPPPGGTIEPAQKAAIKALVDDIVAAAQVRGIRLGQGRNDYPYVWDAFKRRFDLAKYDELAVERYQEAIIWLKAWRDRIHQS
jgi:hypothetical protein